MKEDFISRQAAIERATKEHDFFKGATNPSDKARRDELLNVICWLGELPSQDPWIPVTEKLPVYGEDVLLSMNRDCSIGYLVPTYDERQYEWHHLGCFYYFNEVDAWMPLPTPYKGGEGKC